MSNRDDDEARERERQKRELAKLSPIDRVTGKPIRITDSGRPDGRAIRRVGRVVQFPVRVQLRSIAVIEVVMKRDGYDHRTVLFEEMLRAYLEKYGDVDQSQIASDDELADRYVEAQEKKLAK